MFITFAIIFPVHAEFKISLSMAANVYTKYDAIIIVSILNGNNISLLFI